MDKVKKIGESKWLRWGISIVLIYFAFRKIDIVNLLVEISRVPLWFVAFMLLYIAIVMLIGSWRWALLLLSKPAWKDIVNLTKASYIGGFYGLFFPSVVAVDLVRWVPLLKKYPDMTKTRIATSVLMDRIVGFSAFITSGFIALILGRYLNYQFPQMLLWLFAGLTAGIICFYSLVFTVNFRKILRRWENNRVVKKVLEILDIFKVGNKNRILAAYLLSVVAEPIWMAPYWFNSLIFGTGLTLLQVLIFVPVISLILVLPISVAGFGARENLFLYFLTPLGYAPEKILLMSTFMGIMSVLSNLVGGLFTLEKKK